MSVSTNESEPNESAGEQPQGIYTFSAPSRGGESLELFPVVGGVAAGEVIERNANGPKIWKSFGGSLWGIDSSGNPIKLRDKWG